MLHPNAEQEFLEALTHIGHGGDVVTALRSRCGSLPPLQEAAVNKIADMLEEREPNPHVDTLTFRIEQLEDTLADYRETLKERLT